MIESLNSPHVARVKALIGPRGTKERKSSSLFVAEGLQCAREAMVSNRGPQIQTLYVTTTGKSKAEQITSLDQFNIVEVSDEVMNAMSETITPQGILAICSIPTAKLESIDLNGSRRFIYLSEIQDPGNAGTIIRSADAFGIDAVITSPGSVDLYSPKVVRSTAGSLWHTPIFENVELAHLLDLGIQAFTLAAEGSTSLEDLQISRDCVAIFGNEARGLSTAQSTVSIEEVQISMPGSAESPTLL